MQVERNNGKQSIISMKELIKAKNINDDDSKQIGKWTNAFILTTSRRSYELRSYSYKDRDAWVKAFNKLIQYKREVLRHRGINFDEVFTCPVESRPNYDLTLADFDEHGFIKDLHMISHSNNDVMLIDSIQRKSLNKNQQRKSQDIEETTNIRKLQPSDHELLKKYFNDQQERIQPIGARSRNERAHK